MDRFSIARGNGIPISLLADILADAWCRGKKPEIPSIQNKNRCYNCSQLIFSSQCGITGSGIGNGEQAQACKDCQLPRVQDPWLVTKSRADPGA